MSVTRREATRRRPVHPAACAALLAGLLAAACSESDRPRPNVLVITLDTVRADRLGCYGYARETTPHLDALSKDSVLFREAFAASSFTPPTHASIFTGRYPAEHGLMHWNKHLADVPTAAEMFAAAGYRTGAFTPMPTLLRLGLDRGFQDTASPPYATIGQQNILADADAINAVALPWLTGTGREPESAEADADAADKPFFAWVHYYDAHRPYARQGAQWSGRFTAHDDATVGATEQWYQVGPAARSRIGLTPEKANLLKDHYDGGLAYLDDRVGRLLGGLREAGMLDDTIVLVIGDHGEVFNEHEPEWFAHDPYLFDQNAHVPLLLRLPGRKHAGLRVNDLVSQVDVLPTLLELAGVSAPQPLSGFSLRPLFDRGHIARPFVFADCIGDDLSDRKGKPPPTEAEVKASRDRQRMLRGPARKLLHYEDRGRFEFFEVGTDIGPQPAESVDLAATEPLELRAAITAYAQWRDSLRIPGATDTHGDLTPADDQLLESLGYTGREQREAVPPAGAASPPGSPDAAAPPEEPVPGPPPAGKAPQ